MVRCVLNYVFIMLQGKYSKIVLENYNVIAFSDSCFTGLNGDWNFGGKYYMLEREKLIKLETKEKKTESFGNSLKGEIKKAASCFLVT